MVIDVCFKSMESHQIYDFDNIIYTVSQAAINRTDYSKTFSKLTSMLLTFKLYISIQKKRYQWINMHYVKITKLNKAGIFFCLLREFFLSADCDFFKKYKDSKPTKDLYLPNAQVR